ncbi:MAG: hypothetical protein IJP53_04040 [Synergistaceae bacterium]|nr:hypothetical protein [Synergistaceae bacterium]
MAKKLLTALMLSMFITSGCALAADIDLGEGYHVPASFDRILITSSDGTAIQNAIDHIQNGGVVSLSGDFSLKHCIEIKKNITLKGVDNARAVLDRGAKVRGNKGVIWCEYKGDGDIILENLTITGGNGAFGGGVFAVEGRVTITSCDINNNRALFGGGGVAVGIDVSVFTAESCDVSSNDATIGGGIFFNTRKHRTAQIKDCNIINNHASGNILVFGTGGGLAVLESPLSADNCVIINNSADVSGGGVFIRGEETKLTTISCDITTGNKAPQSADISIQGGASWQDLKDVN